jgi:hypothetical protein
MPYQPNIGAVVFLSASSTSKAHTPNALQLIVYPTRHPKSRRLAAKLASKQFLHIGRYICGRIVDKPKHDPSIVRIEGFGYPHVCTRESSLCPYLKALRICKCH